MKNLTRLDEPQVLIRNKSTWTEQFVKSSDFRPKNNKYAHHEIKSALHQISFNKCFYSEVKFATESEGQVDHYVEVSEDKSLAFEWSNLYLAHKDCNQGKASNKVIPNSQTLDPFEHSDDDIMRHLSFDDEIIFGLTEKGANTIKKYNLGKSIFNTLRSKELRKFEKCLLEYAETTPTKKLSTEQIDVLRRFANSDCAFSLMFRIILTESGWL
jgi:5-methylcytosine-specific restriction endonuclease McrA